MRILNTRERHDCCSKSRRARGGARVAPITFPRASHNTQRTRTQRGDVSTRGARTRPSANARTRERQIDRDTHNTSLGRPSARRRVDSNSDNRHRVFQVVFCLLSMNYTYYMSFLQMLRIYMEIDINGTRGIALYAPILRI